MMLDATEHQKAKETAGPAFRNPWRPIGSPGPRRVGEGVSV